MRRNFILPSEKLPINQHDCRLDSLKYRQRSKLYDVSILTTLLSKTKTSLDCFYDNYLHHSEDLSRFNDNSEMIDFNEKSESEINLYKNQDDEGSNIIMKKNDYSTKIIKDFCLNADSKQYGNIFWPYSVCCNKRDEIIIADSLNSRILIFNMDFIFKYQLGGKLDPNESHFDEPSDIAINDLQKLLVADKNNYRIQIFSEIRKFRQNIQNENNNQNDTIEPSNNSIEYVFDELIELQEKPIKISCSIFSNVTAVSCENGFIFIINDSNHITSYLDLKTRNLNQIKNFSLNEDGCILICLNLKEKLLKFYKTETQITENNEQNDYFVKKKSINHLKLIDQKDLDIEYQPGICLTQATNFRLSQDFKKFLLFDQLNINLIEYNLNGQFETILLKAESGLTNLLSFDFSGDHQHLVTTEAIFNKLINSNKNKIINSNLALKQKSSKTYIPTTNPSKLNFIKKSWPYQFMLKTYNYKDCECHRSSNSKPVSSRLSLLNRNTNLEASFNNFTFITKSSINH